MPLGEHKGFVKQGQKFTNIGKLLEKAWKRMGLHFLTLPQPGKRGEIYGSWNILLYLCPLKILSLLPKFQINETSFKNMISVFS